MILDSNFFHRDCLVVAPELVGKIIAHKMPDGSIHRLRITETEAYRGEDDTACHAHKGRTKRTEILYGESGILYVYLCYGMHWLLNVVTGEKEEPQAVLIRACEGYPGPGRLTKRLGIDGSCNYKSAVHNSEVWFEDDGEKYEYITDKRVGIGYASEDDQNRLWRYKLK